jgi:hypothetical protein
VELSSELIREQAHLIASGVRPLALAGTCEARPVTMLRVTTQLECASGPKAIPFVLDRGDGLADFGYAARSERAAVSSRSHRSDVSILTSRGQ